MSNVKTMQIRGSDLKVGDALVMFGVHRVIELEDYPQLSRLCPGYSGRIANCDDGFSVTIFDSNPINVTA